MTPERLLAIAVLAMAICTIFTNIVLARHAWRLMELETEVDELKRQLS